MKQLIILLIILACVGCKSTTNTTNSLNLPDQYDQPSDSTNIAQLSWREYFQDDNLVALIDSALKNNFDAMMSLQRIQQARAQVRYANGLLSPTVGVGATAAVRRYGLYTMDGAGNSTTEMTPGLIVPTNLPDYLVGFQSSWEADITGKLHNRKRAAVARYLASAEGRNWLITGIVTNVALTYYELVSLHKEHEIVLENIALQQRALNIVTAQKESNAATELAVEQFQNQLLATRSLEREVTQEIIDTESDMNILLGRYPSPIQLNTNALEQPVSQNLNAGLPTQLLRYRSDVREAEFELIASRADVRAAKAAFYPSLNITGSIGYQAFKTNLLFTSPESFMFTLVGGLSAPLINRSALKSEFASANAYQQQTLYDYQKTVVVAFTEVYTELKRIDNLREINKYRDQQVEVANRAIETSNELFLTGRATYLEVLMAQQNALNSKLESIEIKQRRLNATVDLYRALGGGWE